MAVLCASLIIALKGDFYQMVLNLREYLHSAGLGFAVLSWSRHLIVFLVVETVFKSFKFMPGADILARSLLIAYFQPYEQYLIHSDISMGMLTCS